MCIKYDIEMFEEIGFILGIENYLRYIVLCEVGEMFVIFIDFFGDDYLMVIDELYVIIF